MMASRASALRWSACFGLALCFHAAGAAALVARWNDNADSVANAPVITVELGSLVAAPAVVPNDLPNGPLQMQAEPEPRPEKPVDKVEVPVAPHAELELSPPPKTIEKPKDKKPKQKHASLASAPSPAENQADRAVAPAQGSKLGNAQANWNSLVAAQLERYKRPPPDDPRASGTATLAFNVDTAGGVHNARILRGSGSSVIDRETLSLIHRAQPMPPPPPEVSRRSIEVAILYNYR